MGVQVQCEQCKTSFEVIPARAKTAKFCSLRCRGDWRRENYIGPNNPRWQAGAERGKQCQHCGQTFRHKKGPITNFKNRKFCSRTCGEAGQFRPSGKDHANWRPDSRRVNRRGKHGSWARAVIGRDNATCQHCGATDVELHAHHIKSYADHPELRWEIANGLTLCCKCHWKVHSVANEKAVNSGNTLTGGAEGNPEPSHGRKPVEGVTTRGRAYRRWYGECDWCGIFISKRWSDAKGKKHLFCSRSCAALHNSNTREYCRPNNPKTPPKAVISSKSAARESDDIV